MHELVGGWSLQRGSVEAVRIPLRGGGEALVSPEDADRVLERRWYRKQDGACGPYAYGKVRAGTRQSTAMHRFVLSPPHGVEVDHIDGDGLNNTRENLRLATRFENAKNRPKNKTRSGRPTTSPFKGVMRVKSAFVSYIRVDGRRVHLGSFRREHDAARAYDTAAIVHSGAFARTNADMNLFETNPNREI